MASRHRRPQTRHVAAGVAGTALVGALVLTGPGVDPLLRLAATTIVIGGNSDPTSADEWERIKGQYQGPAPVLIEYPADVGFGLPGLRPLSVNGRGTYTDSVDAGATTVAAAIANARQSDDVVVYAISLGADVVGVALGRLPVVPSTGTGKLAVVATGSPSFINTGAWYDILPGVPGLLAGPVAQGPGRSDAEVTSICIKGDVLCGASSNPVLTLFYIVPGAYMHGQDYSAKVIGRYSPTDGRVAFTPGAIGEQPVSTTTQSHNGRTVTIDTYADGTVKRSWFEDGTTWVVIDTGENPWAHLFRSYGLPVPKDVDAVLNRLAPVPEPGEKRITLTSRSTSIVNAATADTAQKPRSTSVATVDNPGVAPSPVVGAHAAERPGGEPFAAMLTRIGADSPTTQTPTSTVAEPVVSAPHTTVAEPDAASSDPDSPTPAHEDPAVLDPPALDSPSTTQVATEAA